MAIRKTPATLKSLPLDLLDTICDYLAADTADKVSLFALSATSQLFHSATSKTRHRSIRITFWNHDELVRNLERWWEILHARDSMRHVRRLTILEKRRNTRPTDRWPQGVADGELFLHNHNEWPLDADDEFWTLSGPVPYDPCLPPPQGVVGQLWPNPWEMLADVFISRMTGLKDVVYQCQRQVPACILDAVQAHPNGVRLHVDTFCLRSLCQPRERPHDIDPFEYQLASSPCLSSIRAAIRLERPHLAYEVRACYLREAIQEMVAGLAPNLKSLSVNWSHIHTVGFLYALADAELSQEKPKWQGFFADRPSSASSQPCGALETLILSGKPPRVPTFVSDWSHLTDFSKLRSLHLRTMMDEFALRPLVEIAEAGTFRLLRTLSLWTGTPAGDIASEEEIDAELSRLLRALRPLKTLELQGLFADAAFDEVLRVHGESLEGLRLVPWSNNSLCPAHFALTHGLTEALVCACPNIRDLELLTPRTGGDESEAGIYQSLGRLRRLDRLSLLLDCSSGSQVTYYDLRDPEAALPDDLCDSISKFCINRLFASDIFETLCHGGAPRFIRLVPARIGHSSGDTIWHVRDVAEVLAGAWMRVRDPRQGHEGEFRMVVVRTRGDGGPGNRVVEEVGREGLYRDMVERLRRRVDEAGLKGTCAVFEDVAGLECPRLWGCN